MSSLGSLKTKLYFTQCGEGFFFPDNRRVGNWTNGCALRNCFAWNLFPLFKWKKKKQKTFSGWFSVSYLIFACDLHNSFRMRPPLHDGAFDLLSSRWIKDGLCFVSFSFLVLLFLPPSVPTAEHCTALHSCLCIQKERKKKEKPLGSARFSPQFLFFYFI